MTKKNDNFTFRFPADLRRRVEEAALNAPYSPTVAKFIIAALEKYLKNSEKKTK